MRRRRIRHRPIRHLPTHNRRIRRHRAAANNALIVGDPRPGAPGCGDSDYFGYSMTGISVTESTGKLFRFAASRTAASLGPV